MFSLLERGAALNRGLTAISCGRYRGWGRSVAESAAFRKAFTTLLAAPDAVSLTSGTDRWVYAMPWHGRTYYIKRYAVWTLKARLQSLVGRNKAQNAWRFALHLKRLGIPTPRMVAHLWWTGWDGRREHVLISEGVAGATLRSVLDGPTTSAQRRPLLKAVAEFLADLHEKGVYHGDFTARNVIVASGKSAPSAKRIFLIDMDAIRSIGHISIRRQIKNLDELGRNFHDLSKVTVSDRLRFLVRYHAARRSSKHPLKELRTRVCDRTTERMRAVGLDFSPHGDRV